MSVVLRSLGMNCEPEASSRGYHLSTYHRPVVFLETRSRPFFFCTTLLPPQNTRQQLAPIHGRFSSRQQRVLPISEAVAWDTSRGRTRDSRTSEHKAALRIDSQERANSSNVVSKVLPTAVEQPNKRVPTCAFLPKRQPNHGKPGRLTSPAATPPKSAMSCGRDPKSRKPAVHLERRLRPLSMLATRARARRSLFPSKTKSMQNSHNGIIATRSLTNTSMARRTNRCMPY